MVCELNLAGHVFLLPWLGSDMMAGLVSWVTFLLSELSVLYCLLAYSIADGWSQTHLTLVPSHSLWKLVSFFYF